MPTTGSYTDNAGASYWSSSRLVGWLACWLAFCIWVVSIAVNLTFSILWCCVVFLPSSSFSGASSSIRPSYVRENAGRSSSEQVLQCFGNQSIEVDRDSNSTSDNTTRCTLAAEGSQSLWPRAMTAGCHDVISMMKFPPKYEMVSTCKSDQKQQSRLGTRLKYTFGDIAIKICAIFSRLAASIQF
jgi:hypothetical protein